MMRFSYQGHPAPAEERFFAKVDMDGPVPGRMSCMPVRQGHPAERFRDPCHFGTWAWKHNQWVFTRDVGTGSASRSVSG